MDENKKTPLLTFKAWPITATLWDNESEFGVFPSIQISRSYKDKNDNWMNTQSLRETDLPKTILLLNKVYDFVLSRKNTRNNIKGEEL